MHPTAPAAALSAAEESARERADCLAIARAALALRDALPALARATSVTGTLLAAGFASHLAGLLDSTSHQEDLDAAEAELGRDARAAELTAAEMLFADGGQQAGAEG